MKIMTYNIRHGWGIKKLFGLKDIFHTIKEYQPDIVCLNEVDRYNPRSLFINQAKSLAKRLKYHYVFQPNLKIGPIGYGNAIVTRFPILEIENYSLYSKGEQRGCLSVLLDLVNNEVKKIRVLCTHLGLDNLERKVQIDQLVNIIKKKEEPTLLLGDFNCNPQELMPLKEILFDSLLHSDERDKCHNTYPAVNSTQRLDYIFYNFGFHACTHRTIFSEASDHLPVLAGLKLVKGSKNV